MFGRTCNREPGGLGEGKLNYRARVTKQGQPSEDWG
jgi:hypothetical protein